jgi:hypothetical protein
MHFLCAVGTVKRRGVRLRRGIGMGPHEEENCNTALGMSQ